jgi:hypothetical protein
MSDLDEVVEEKKCKSCQCCRPLEYFRNYRTGRPYLQCVLCRDGAKWKSCGKNCVREGKCLNESSGVVLTCVYRKLLAYNKYCLVCKKYKYDSIMIVNDDNTAICHACEKKRLLAISEVCQHKNIRKDCPDCYDIIALIEEYSEIMRNMSSDLIDEERKDEIYPFLQCSCRTFRKHMERIFDEKMSWKNYSYYWGNYHKPNIDKNTCTLSQVQDWLHYTNVFPHVLPPKYRRKI